MKRVLALGIAVVLVVSAGVGTVAALNYGCKSPSSIAFPPCQARPATVREAFNVVVNANSDAMVRFLATQAAPYLRSGDIVHFESGTSAQINSWVATLRTALPQGVIFAADGNATTSGGVNATEVPFAVLGTGPDGNTSQVVATFQGFATSARAEGFKAIGYPVGRASALEGWNYGRFADVLDGLWVQTQASLHNDYVDNESTLPHFSNEVKTLETELGNYGLTPSNYDFLCQVTVGLNDPNLVSPAFAVQGLEYLQSQGFHYGYVWWDVGPELVSTLQLLGR